MRSKFHDKSDTDYDALIEEAKQKMDKVDCKPCEQLREVDLLIHQLKGKHNLYAKRPCHAGWCLGLFTPHRERIRERISNFESERNIHDLACQEQRQEEKKKFRTTLFAKELEIRSIYERSEEKHIKEKGIPPNTPTLSGSL